MRENKTAHRAAGIGLILVVLTAFGLTAALYTHAFSNPAEITLRTARIGLVMDPGNVVKMRGIKVGTVGAVHRVEGGFAELVLEIDRDELDRIPANVGARIRSTTVFGAKYVELVTPDAPVTARLAAGDTLEATGVTTEVNTVFRSLDKVLTGIDAADLNVTLTELARALDGRGDTIASIATQASDYLTDLEPLLPQLRRDLVEVARFARLGEQVSPALLRILENATVTGRTIVTQQQAIDQLLVDLSILGGKGAEVLGVNADALTSLLRALRPTTGTLAAYSSELPCLLEGLANARGVMADVIGGTSAGLRARVSIRSELPPYTRAKDLPTLARGHGVGCHGMPLLRPDQIPVPEKGAPQ